MASRFPCNRSKNLFSFFLKHIYEVLTKHSADVGSPLLGHMVIYLSFWSDEHPARPPQRRTEAGQPCSISPRPSAGAARRAYEQLEFAARPRPTPTQPVQRPTHQLKHAQHTCAVAYSYIASPVTYHVIATLALHLDDDATCMRRAVRRAVASRSSLSATRKTRRPSSSSAPARFVPNMYYYCTLRIYIGVFIHMHAF